MVTEKLGINYMLQVPGYFLVDKNIRKSILLALNSSNKYLQAFDMIYIPGITKEMMESNEITFYINEIVLIELKTTKKYLPNMPEDLFFGYTENERAFAESIGNKFRFVFISLHKDSLSYVKVSLEELESNLKSKRPQYQSVSGRIDTPIYGLQHLV